MIRWYLDLAIVGTRIVGKVCQLPPPDDTPKYGPRPSAPWEAVGMLTDWSDTDLGEHPTRSAAKQAITDWWANQ